jgi:hypothetical protein
VVLRPEAVPFGVRSLLPLAEEWGVGDDIDREEKVSTSSRAVLESLVSAVDSAADELWSWLAGPESRMRDPSPEYVAVSCMTMAADSARQELARP